MIKKNDMKNNEVTEMSEKKLKFKDLWFDIFLVVSLSLYKIIHYINTEKTGLLINSYAELIIISGLFAILVGKIFMICTEKYTITGKRKLFAGITTSIMLFAIVYSSIVGWMYLVNYEPQEYTLLFEIVLEEDAPYITGLISLLVFVLYALYKMKIQIVNPEIDYYEMVSNENDINVDYQSADKDDQQIKLFRKIYKTECEGVFKDEVPEIDENTNAYKIIIDEKCVGYFLTKVSNETVEIFEGYVSGCIRHQLTAYCKALLSFLKDIKPKTRIEFSNLSITKSPYKKCEFEILEIFAKEYSCGKNYDISCDKGQYRMIMKTRGEQDEIND